MSTVNPMRHLSIFNPLLFENRQIHIIGTNEVAKNIAYLVAKLGVDNFNFHTFTQQGDAAKKIATFTDEMAEIKPIIHIHESASFTEVAFDDVVFVAEDISVRPELYRNILEVSMSTMVVFDVRLDKDNLPLIHTLKPEDLYTYEALYASDNPGWHESTTNPIAAMLLAVWATNQFITWTQQTFQMEGKEDRVVQPVQSIRPSHKRLIMPPIYNPFDSRFDDLKNRAISVVGVGATGSNLVGVLAACGFKNITGYDYDIIESHNIANQWFQQKQIDLPKVEALKQNVQKYYGLAIEVRNEKVEKGQQMGEIVFLLTDSMPSRKGVATNLVENSLVVTTLIETRMGAELMQLYVVDNTHEGSYTEWFNTLFDEAIARPEVSACGTSITVGTTAMLCATYAVNQLFHLEAARQDGKPIPIHSVFADMYPPYPIIK